MIVLPIFSLAVSFLCTFVAGKAHEDREYAWCCLLLLVAAVNFLHAIAGALVLMGGEA